jgi:uncharacterized protein (TIGR02246 family)
MPTTTNPTRDDAQIRESIDAMAQALRAKDINALMAHYAPDIVTFDLMPLQSRGVDAYRKHFEAWFASVQGPIDYEMRDLRITRKDDVAFCHYLGCVKSTRTTGEKTDYRVRGDCGSPDDERAVDGHPMSMCRCRSSIGRQCKLHLRQPKRPRIARTVPGLRCARCRGRRAPPSAHLRMAWRSMWAAVKLRLRGKRR